MVEISTFNKNAQTRSLPCLENVEAIAHLTTETRLMIPADHDAVPNPAAGNYRIRLHPWCIVRLLPRMQRMVIQRFRTRTQAEEYLRILQNLMPTTAHQIVFDPETE